jgi:hypothetical protein
LLFAVSARRHTCRGEIAERDGVRTDRAPAGVSGVVTTTIASKGAVEPDEVGACAPPAWVVRWGYPGRTKPNAEQ